MDWAARLVADVEDVTVEKAVGGGWEWVQSLRRGA
jgi:hypothetical protein